MIDKLVEECTENIDQTKIINKTENENKDRCNFCVVYNVLFFIFFIISIGIGTYFVYCKYGNCNKYDFPY